MNALIPFAQSLAACAVCGASKSANDSTVGVVIIVLSMLPIGMLAVGTYLMVRAHRRAHQNDEAALAPPAE